MTGEREPGHAGGEDDRAAVMALEFSQHGLEQGARIAAATTDIQNYTSS